MLGESLIAEFKKGTDKRIERVRLVPPHPQALDEVLEAIGEADMIVLGPGSLYTSIMPNLLCAGVAEAVANSDAFRIYVLNIMTQDGETEGYTASDHIGAIFSNSGRRLFDWCLANSGEIPPEVREKYAREGAEPVAVDVPAVQELGVGLIYAPVAAWRNGVIRHDPDALAAELLRAYREKSHTRVYE